MTGYQSKKNLRFADDVTLSHLIDLRKLEAENERLKEALKKIILFEGGNVFDVLHEIHSIAVEALEESDGHC